jgi:Na+-transporting methylmalonyl-CoA/oxaloacetate decarboxylase gamma subunit
MNTANLNHYADALEILVTIGGIGFIFLLLCCLAAVIGRLSPQDVEE